MSKKPSLPYRNFCAGVSAAKYLSNPSTFCCTMSMPTMQAAASSTSSTTPKRTLLRRLRERVMRDADSAAAVGGFGTRTSLFVSSIADILIGGEQKKRAAGGAARPLKGTLSAASRMITKAALHG